MPRVKYHSRESISTYYKTIYNNMAILPLVIGLAVYVAVPVETFRIGGQSPGTLGTL